MSTCTFFGHSDAPIEIEANLREVLYKLIENGVNTFLVGNNGNFDRLVRKILKEIKIEMPQIRYSVVLAYMPGQTGG